MNFKYLVVLFTTKYTCLLDTSKQFILGTQFSDISNLHCYRPVNFSSYMQRKCRYLSSISKPFSMYIPNLPTSIVLAPL